jgi:hypothetical protein
MYRKILAVISDVGDLAPDHVAGSWFGLKMQIDPLEPHRDDRVVSLFSLSPPAPLMRP